jgi:hypothetical protein
MKWPFFVPLALPNGREHVDLQVGTFGSIAPGPPAVHCHNRIRPGCGSWQLFSSLPRLPRMCAYGLSSAVGRPRDHRQELNADPTASKSEI